MKKLLIITQKVDEEDDILGFFIEWIRRLSQRADHIYVICLFKGKYNLPANVEVVSLGKEEAESDPKYLFRFYRYIWQLRDDYDSVFVHMNPMYVVLGGIFWRAFKKKIVLWYAHGNVSSILRVADKLTNVSVASTPEGYRIKSSKLRVIGQGIDTEKFKNQNSKTKNTGDKFKIVSVGRISPSKDYETLVKAVQKLRNEGVTNFEVEIAGHPMTKKSIIYLETLKKAIDNNNLADSFKLIGPIANKDLPPFLNSADLFVNMSHTGSLDKAILEAMSCGLPVLTCNEALENVLGRHKDVLMYSKKDSRALAEKINSMINMPSEERAKLSSALREIVVRNHNLDGFIDKLTSILL